MPDSRRDGSTTAPQTDRSISAESPVVRDTRSSDARRDGPRIPNLTGVYRKEYADLGQIWRQRTETRRQDPRSRYHDDYRDDHRDGTNVFVNVNIFPNAYYPHYAYEYDPWYSYPSVYCYYSGLFPPYINYQRVVYIQRPVVVYRYVDIPMTIIYRDDPVYYRDSDNSDDYYLNSYRYRYLYDTLRHIERAWEQSDPDMLLDHVRKNSKLDIFLKDDYAYTIDWQDFAEMTEDAMSHIRTVDFEVYKIRQREYGTVEVFAKHTYYDVDGYDPYAPDRDPVLSYDYSSAKRNTVYLQYTLEKNGNNWYIVEVGTSPNRAR